MQSTPERVAAGEDKLMDVRDAAKFLGYKVSWLYQLCHLRRVPFYKTGRKTFFSRLELASWAMRERRKSQQEIDDESLKHIEAVESR